MRTTILGIMICGIVFGGPAVQPKAAHGGWELESDKDGIQVYTRSVHGTDIKQIKAVTFIEAPMAAVMQVLTDYDNYKTWMNNVRKSHVMEEQDEANSIVYTFEDAPWPVQNRFHVDKMTVNLGEEVSTLVFKSIPDFIDESPDAIESTSNEGFWRVRASDGGGCEIEYVMDQNPGGYIPSWLVNQMAIEAPYKTLKKLKSRIIEAQRS